MTTEQDGMKKWMKDSLLTNCVECFREGIQQERERIRTFIKQDKIIGNMDKAYLIEQIDSQPNNSEGTRTADHGQTCQKGLVGSKSKLGDKKQ